MMSCTIKYSHPSHEVAVCFLLLAKQMRNIDVRKILSIFFGDL
ncbi:hypothetical protein A1OE_1463 [Candidatus Endolissoclinum faulkneri L2]|uniref:Uncharacterized protein n=1 Tax=Candidatus Endolissoclinum faulkneri L2 TaxID=1193729 RepID=K7YQ03_9PROT|nr:hypothetical protein A1OE_1463 [Candidatus Endolissoclinum faulkneri L2]